jgi:hypothetical protein
MKRRAMQIEAQRTKKIVLEWECYAGMSKWECPIFSPAPDSNVKCARDDNGCSVCVDGQTGPDRKEQGSRMYVGMYA